MKGRKAKGKLAPKMKFCPLGGTNQKIWKNQVSKKRGTRFKHLSQVTERG